MEVGASEIKADAKAQWDFSWMRKRSGTSVDSSAIVNVWKREVGELSSQNFSRYFCASQDLVLRLVISRKLEKHRGCVNTVSFNVEGDILVSGSDDRRVILWDWKSGHPNLSFHSGHHNNIFQAKIMPYTDNTSIVTCAADGEVRHAQISEGGKVETALLTTHNGCAHKLAIEPGSCHIFYTCGEDGLVQHIDLRTGAASELITCRPVRDQNHMPFLPLNTIAIDPRNPNFFVVAGTDEFARLFDIRKYKRDGSSDLGLPVEYYCPSHLVANVHVGITGLAFSYQSELLASYENEFIYLFTRDMGMGSDPVPISSVTSAGSSDAVGPGNHSDGYTSSMNVDAKVVPQVYKGHINGMTVKGVNFFGPKCEYVVSGSDCGRIFIWKKKGGELIRVMDADKDVVNCIDSHPHTMVLASSGIEHNIKIWTPEAIDKATLPTNIQKYEVSMPRRIEFFPEVSMPRRIQFFPIEFDVDSDEEEEYTSDAVSDDDDDDNDDNDDNDDDDDDADEDDGDSDDDGDDEGDGEDDGDVDGDSGGDDYGDLDNDYDDDFFYDSDYDSGGDNDEGEEDENFL